MMTRSDYEVVAKAINELQLLPIFKNLVIEKFIKTFSREYRNFKPLAFDEACRRDVDPDKNTALPPPTTGGGGV